MAKTFTGEDWEKGFNHMFKMLPDKVKEYISRGVDDKLLNYFSSIKDCESPIEQLMGLALWDITERDHFYGLEILQFKSQQTVKCDKKTYRVDFMVDCLYEEKLLKAIVECDGHDYHERTKEQARKDKQRARELAAAGYIVIHFTGSEIYNNPYQCAREVVKIIKSQQQSGE